MGKKINILFLLYSISLFACFLHGNSQGIKLKVGVDSTHILIGDQVKLGFEVTQPKNVVIEFPQFLDSIVDKIEIIEIFDKDTSWISNQEFTVKQEYLVTSFDSGFYYFPPYNFPIKSDFIDDTMQSKPFFLQVFTIPIDTTQGIFDIKKPYETPLSFKEVLPYITYSIIGIIVAGLIIYILIKRKRNEPVFQRVKPKIPPHILALDELDKLKQKKLWQQGKIKEYYTRLTEIIRIYLEGRFFVRAMEYTTDETIDMFVQTNNDPDLVLELKELLTVADFVKFAKHNPLPDENEKCFQISYDFVRKTKPIAEIENISENTQNQLELAESNNQEAENSQK